MPLQPPRCTQSASELSEVGMTHPQENISYYPNKNHYQVENLVIGSGPGGAITAYHLAKAGQEVLLAERGPFIQQGLIKPYSLEEMTHKYNQAGLTITMGQSKISYGEAHCVGGGSEINAGFYHEIPPEILERWHKEFELQAARHFDLLPHFKATAEFVKVQKANCQVPESSLRLHKGACSKGWKSFEVPRWYDYEKKKKISMSESYIPEALQLGMKLLSRSNLKRIKKVGKKWEVLFSHFNQLFKIETSHLFLGCGVITTGYLLRRLGLSLNAGNHIQLHPMLKVTARFTEPVNQNRDMISVHQVKEFSPEMSFGCSISSDPFIAVGINGPSKTILKLEQSDTNFLANYYTSIIPEGEGSVSKVPFFNSPYLKYKLSKKDYEKIYLGLARLSEMLLESEATEIYPSIYGHNPINKKNTVIHEQWRDHAKHFNLMTIHMFSSCPMGENKKKAVVDSFGRVHGHENLYVVDGSLLCSAPSVNPQGGIMAFSRRNILHFLGKD